MSEPRTSDPNVDRVIRSWLHTDRHEDVSRVAGSVLDLLDTTPQRRSPWWPARRLPIMNKFVSLGLGVAAVVVALVIRMIMSVVVTLIAVRMRVFVRGFHAGCLQEVCESVSGNPTMER